MADVLVTGIKIGDMPLKGAVSGNEKLPTGDVGDLAVTPNQIKDFTIAEGDLVDQTTLDDAVEALEQTSSGLAGRVQTLENRTSNINNTADLDKPISNATQAALELKANTADVYDKSSVYNKTETYNRAEILNLLSSKADSSNVVNSINNKKGVVNLLSSDVVSVSGTQLLPIPLNSDVYALQNKDGSVATEVNSQAQSLLNKFTWLLNSQEFKKKTIENKTLSQMMVYQFIDFDSNETISVVVKATNGKIIKSNKHRLTQTTPSTSNLIIDYDQNDVEINGLDFLQDKSTPIGGGTLNDHQMTKAYGGLYNRIINNTYDGQFAISLAYGSATLPDRRGLFGLVAFNTGLDIQGMWIENIGSAYNRIIGNILNSATKGLQHGLRFSGYNKINNPSESTHAPCWAIVGNSNIYRNITNGHSYQNSSAYSIVGTTHFNNVDCCIHSTAGTVSNNDPTMHIVDFTANEVGKAIANLTMNHCHFKFAVDGSSFTSTGIEELSTRGGTGFNHYDGVIQNSAQTAMQLRYSHNTVNFRAEKVTGTGAVISGNYNSGNITINDATNGVQIYGNNNNFRIVATSCTNLALQIAGNDNVIEIVSDGNILVTGSGNTVTCNTTGNLNLNSGSLNGSNNRFIGKVGGTVTRGSGTGNEYTSLLGWGSVVYQPNAVTTTSNGRVTVTVPKHSSSQIRSVFATIPINPNGYTSEVVSISADTVIFEFKDRTGVLLNAQSITFNYEYSCS